jgi:hypothetical protein
MGTSSSYKGPTGTTSLLPPWADAPPETQATPPDHAVTPAADGENEGGETPAGQPEPVSGAPPRQVSWRAPKATITRYASGASSSPRSTFRSYVRAHGGGGGASRASVAGRQSARGILGFLSDAARNGLAAAAERIGIRDLVGRDAQSVLAALIDILAPEGALLEDAAARVAVIDTMTELFEALDVETNGIGVLDRLSENDLAQTLEVCICNVIEARFTQELASRVEQAAMDVTEANRTLGEIRDYIRGLVALDLEGKRLLDIDWNGSEGASFIESWLAAAYAVLEEAE